jgi:hypothetical protein
VTIGWMVFVLIITSFPFLVGTTLGADLVLTWPLDVGWVVSNVMGWSSPDIIFGSARSIRLVIGMGAVVY